MKSDLNQKLAAAGDQQAGYEQKLRSVPRKEKDLVDKFRKQSITEDLYVYLLKKKEETALSLVGNYSNSTLVDAPRSGLFPVSPFMVVFEVYTFWQKKCREWTLVRWKLPSAILTRSFAADMKLQVKY